MGLFSSGIFNACYPHSCASAHEFPDDARIRLRVLTSRNEIRLALRPFDNTSDLRLRSKKEFVMCLGIDDHFVIEQKNLFISIYFYRSNAMDTFSILKVWKQMKKQDQKQH